VNNPLTKGSTLPDEESIPVWMREAFNSIQQNGVSVYTEDRNRAFRWYSERRLPIYDYSTEPGLQIIRTYAFHADEASVWNEAWALCHQVLVGCAVQGKQPLAVEALWKLGRSQIGLEQYQLAELCLQAAKTVLTTHPDKNFELRIMMDHAVLTAISRDLSTLDEESDALVAFLSNSGAASSLENVAKALFSEGMKNDKWEKDGAPVPSCQRHAAGLYLVSIRLNRKVDNRRAIAIMLVNLGNIWVGLGETEKADTCWNELQSYLSEVSGDRNLERFKDGLQKLRSQAAKPHVSTSKEKRWKFWK
jgi:hypothetical protein